MRKLLVALALLTVAAGCGSADEDTGAAPTSTVVAPVTTTVRPVPHPPEPLVIIAEVGGCYMLGPNCTTTLVMSDGTFGVFRNDPVDVIGVPASLDEADFTGETDVTALVRLTAETDFDQLRSSLDPGECRACVDGIDYQVRLMTPGGPEDLNSVDYDFDPKLELFAELDSMVQVAQESGTIEMMPRGS